MRSAWEYDVETANGYTRKADTTGLQARDRFAHRVIVPLHAHAVSYVFLAPAQSSDSSLLVAKQPRQHES
ncbi:hypothetical protein CBOM_07884 [Ceraceosorus bombacis]|uniref:Uncharacterized protein n=1 Tax=Ceraceosorus bombacis TaxID=401625 RepID=A0A0P1BHR0_9BASI|nr:hypothetical protein CBOM_07884 [Ceraceosorus bombacis]